MLYYGATFICLDSPATSILILFTSLREDGIYLTDVFRWGDAAQSFRGTCTSVNTTRSYKPTRLTPRTLLPTTDWRSRHGKTDFPSASSDARSSYTHLLQTPQADLRHRWFEGDRLCGSHTERRDYLWCSMKSSQVPTLSGKRLHVSLRAEDIRFPNSGII